MKSGKRSFLKQQFKPCWQLLEAMGIAWHQAPGEAEKMCAALQMLGLVDAIITQVQLIYFYFVSLWCSALSIQE